MKLIALLLSLGLLAVATAAAVDAPVSYNGSLSSVVTELDFYALGV